MFRPLKCYLQVFFRHTINHCLVPSYLRLHIDAIFSNFEGQLNRGHSRSQELLEVGSLTDGSYHAPKCPSFARFESCLVTLHSLRINHAGFGNRLGGKYFNFHHFSRNDLQAAD
jgi:hypothetical protein